MEQWRSEVLATQSCLTLCDPIYDSPPGSSVHGILQARTLESVTMPSSRGSSQLRAWTYISCIAGVFFTFWATREAPLSTYSPTKCSTPASVFLTNKPRHLHLHSFLMSFLPWITFCFLTHFAFSFSLATHIINFQMSFHISLVRAYLTTIIPVNLTSFSCTQLQYFSFSHENIYDFVLRLEWEPKKAIVKFVCLIFATHLPSS